LSQTKCQMAAAAAAKPMRIPIAVVARLCFIIAPMLVEKAATGSGGSAPEPVCEATLRVAV